MFLSLPPSPTPSLLTIGRRPRGSPRLSQSVDVAEELGAQPYVYAILPSVFFDAHPHFSTSSPEPSPPRSPRVVSRAASTPAIIAVPLTASSSAPVVPSSSPATQRRSSPQPIHTSTLSNSSERNSPSALLSPASPSTPPKQRLLSLSDEVA